MISTAFIEKILDSSSCCGGLQIWDRFYTECVGGTMWENVFSFSLLCVCVCTCVSVSYILPVAQPGGGMMGPTHAGTPQLFRLCVLYKDFITRCFREVFTLLGESKCQWHPSWPGCHLRINRVSVWLCSCCLQTASVSVRPGNATSLLTAACAALTPAPAGRARQLPTRLCAPPR